MSAYTCVRKGHGARRKDVPWGVRGMWHRIVMDKGTNVRQGVMFHPTCSSSGPDKIAVKKGPRDLVTDRVSSMSH